MDLSLLRTAKSGMARILSALRIHQGDDCIGPIDPEIRRRPLRILESLRIRRRGEIMSDDMMCPGCFIPLELKNEPVRVKAKDGMPTRFRTFVYKCPNCSYERTVYR